MSLSAFVKRLVSNVVPTQSRASGGPYITCAPANAAFKQLQAHATKGISAWGNMVELLSATANTTDCWVEAVMINQATAAMELNVAITMETGTGAPTAAQIEAIVPAYVDTGAAGQVIVPVKPPVYIPAGNRIAAALAGTATKKVDCAVIISRRR